MSAVVVDAVSSGARPGTRAPLRREQRNAVPARVFRSSTHAFGVGEAIELGARARPAAGRASSSSASRARRSRGRRARAVRRSQRAVERASSEDRRARRRRDARAGTDARRRGARSSRSPRRAARPRVTRVASASAPCRTSRPTTSGSTSRTPSRGTLAEGAEVDAVLDDDLHAAERGDVRRRDVEQLGGGGPDVPRRDRPARRDAGRKGGARVGRLDDGGVVPLAFVPEARAGTTTCSSTSASPSRCSTAPRQPQRIALARRTPGGAP